MLQACYSAISSSSNELTTVIPSIPTIITFYTAVYIYRSGMVRCAVYSRFALIIVYNIPGKMCSYAHESHDHYHASPCIRCSTAVPKSSNVVTFWDANNTGSRIGMRENDKSPRWKEGCGLCASIGFRLVYRHRCRLSEWMFVVRFGNDMYRCRYRLSFFLLSYRNF